MAVFNNKEHFLYRKLIFLESVSNLDLPEKFDDFLAGMGVDVSSPIINEDNSLINWTATKPHFQFFFDYVGNEEEMKVYLENSEISKHEFLYTWLAIGDPVIKVKTVEFIENWEDFYIASVQGFVAITPDGRYYLEFTDDWKYHLNSNFEIRSGTIVEY